MTDHYEIIESYEQPIKGKKDETEVIDLDILLNEILNEKGVTTIDDITILGKHRLLLKLDIDEDDFRGGKDD